MTPVQCCMKCPRAVKGATWLCGWDNVICGWHHKADYCPTACFGADAKPEFWADVPRGVEIDPNYDPAKHFHKDGCNCGGLADTTKA